MSKISVDLRVFFVFSEYVDMKIFSFKPLQRRDQQKQKTKVMQKAWPGVSKIWRRFDKLCSFQASQPLLVATAHIHWDPEFCDVKLIQTMMLMDQLKKIQEESATNFRPGQKYDPSAIQLLLCGDFNSLPDSGVFEFLQNSKIRADHSDFKQLKYKTNLQKMLSNSSGPNEQFYTHNFKLQSVFNKDIMPYTNYTYDFKGMIDYIFYPSNTMKPLGYLGPISEDWLNDNKVLGCPHPHITSGTTTTRLERTFFERVFILPSFLLLFRSFFSAS